MKKLFVLVTLVAALGISNVSAFAAETKSSEIQEVYLSSEIEQKLESTITHEDGSVTVLHPEYTLYKVGNRSGESQQYMLKMEQSYDFAKSRSNGSDSDYDDANMDASVTGVIWFTRYAIAGDELDRIKVDFESGSGVQVFNRTVYYKGNGTAGTNERNENIGMNYDKNISGVSGDDTLGVTVRVEADVNYSNTKDTLKIKMTS